MATLKRQHHRSTWDPAWGRCPKNGKRSYPTRHLARVACHGVGGGDIYRCPDPYCGKYHLTRYPPAVARAISYLLESMREDREKTKGKHVQA